MKKSGYAGRIKNQGTQAVKAPLGSKDAVKGTARISGSDLRTGRQSKK